MIRRRTNYTVQVVPYSLEKRRISIRRCFNVGPASADAGPALKQRRITLTTCVSRTLAIRLTNYKQRTRLAVVVTEGTATNLEMSNMLKLLLLRCIAERDKTVWALSTHNSYCDERPEKVVIVEKKVFIMRAIIR